MTAIVRLMRLVVALGRARQCHRFFVIAGDGSGRREADGCPAKATQEARATRASKQFLEEGSVMDKRLGSLNAAFLKLASIAAVVGVLGCGGGGGGTSAPAPAAALAPAGAA